MKNRLKLVTAAAARARILPLLHPLAGAERVETASALGRVLAQDLFAPHALPEFRRSSVDGYALISGDPMGVQGAEHRNLRCVREILMGSSADFALSHGECALIHTGGMLPAGADAVLMLEDAVPTDAAPSASAWHPYDVTALKRVRQGENVIDIGEDVAPGQLVLTKGKRLLPADIGGLMALGLTSVHVARKPIVALIASGDEVVDASTRPVSGQVRDVNTYSIAAHIAQLGGMARHFGIIRDEGGALLEAAQAAIVDSDVVIISGGTSASARDAAAGVIAQLGVPGVLVHGISIRPGKPAILAVCNGKPVIGLPGNPVSALMISALFLAPVMSALLGRKILPAVPRVPARLATDLECPVGREDWWSVRLLPPATADQLPIAQPILGKSNLIFTMASGDGMVRIGEDASGAKAGDVVDVIPFENLGELQDS